MTFINLDFILDFGPKNILILLTGLSFINGLNLFPMSQLILIIGGLVVGLYDVNFFLVFGLLVVSNFVANYLLYFVAFRWGEETIRKILPIKTRTLDNDILVMDYFFDKYGSYVIFFGRNLPVLHSLVSIPAGLAKVPRLKFCVYTLLGICTWSLLFIGVGFLLGSNYEYFLDRFEFFGLLVALIVVGTIWYFFRFYWGSILRKAKKAA